MGNLIDCGKTLDAVANRDLTVKVKLISDKDTMGTAIKMMVENLNIIFGEIRMSSGKVSAGADQVAHGTQALASGSSHQAASIEEFSASLNELQEKPIAMLISPLKRKMLITKQQNTLKTAFSP